MFSFTLQEFLAMIASYNVASWPLQVVAYALRIAALVLAMSSGTHASRIASGILAVFWLWVGIVFNGRWFPVLDARATIFAVLFVIQAILLGMTGVVGKGLVFAVRRDAYGVAGGLAILYAMVGYPVIEHLLGRGYPESLLLGMVPCPTTTFTLGMLLWSQRPVPKAVLVIPAFYAVAAGAIVASQGIVEDVGMATVGVAATALLLYRDRYREREPEPAGLGGA